MGSRGTRRALVAAVAALVLHTAVALWALRARPLPVSSSPARIQVALLGVRPRLPTMATGSPRTAEPPAPPRRATQSTPPPAAGTPAPAPNVVTEDGTAPTLAEPPAPTRADDARPSIVRQRSLVERVVVGATAGPAPSLDVLDPARKTAGHDQSETQRAKRFVDSIARVEALSVDAGPAHIALTPTESGGYVYNTGGFSAEIHEDGSVTFEDHPTKTGFGHSGIDGGDPLRPFQPGIQPGQSAADAASQRMAASAELASMSFDPTAALMRAQGQDPYEAERSCFLDDTRELRADLRKKHEAVQLAGLRRALEKAWFDEVGAAALRRAALFAMWDDCREEEVGVLARVLIESFVRQHLPEGSDDAFTDDELTALNARRVSLAEFKPYG